MTNWRHRRVTLSLGAFLALGAMTASRANRDALLDRIGAHPVAAAALTDTPETPAIVLPEVRSHQNIPRAADGLFYVDAKVNGRPIRFLVDTGASVVVLTAADAAAIGAAPETASFSASVQTVGGNTNMAWTTIDTVSIGGKHARRIRAAVVRGDLPVSLLGQNALSKLGGLTIRNDRLSLG